MIYLLLCTLYTYSTIQYLVFSLIPISTLSNSHKINSNFYMKTFIHPFTAIGLYIIILSVLQNQTIYVNLFIFYNYV